MTKRQLIEEILTMNRTAQPEFLARFQEGELGEYLSHLRHARVSRLIGDSSRYARFFRDEAAMAIPAGPAVARVEPPCAPPTFPPAAEPAEEVSPVAAATVPADQTPNCSEYVTARFDADTYAENCRPEVEDHSCRGSVVDLKTDVDAMKEQVSVSSRPAPEETASPEPAEVSVLAGYNGSVEDDESSFAKEEDRKWLF